MRDLVVGVGDGAVSRDPNTVLVTYALGSCVAVLLHAPVVAEFVVLIVLLAVVYRQKPGKQPDVFVRGYLSVILAGLAVVVLGQRAAMATRRGTAPPPDRLAELGTD